MILFVFIVISWPEIMLTRRVLRCFSQLNKLHTRQRLRQGTTFPRAPSNIIPQSHISPTQIPLSPFQLYLINNKAMQRPFTGNLWHEMSAGFYHCAVCDARLFTFNYKYQSHTGYPTFWRAIQGSIKTVDEQVKFDEVNHMRARHQTDNNIHKRCYCSNCQSHLGAVFMDGPPPTFLRYTISSALLKFYDMPDFPNPHILRKQKKEAAKAHRIKYLR